MTKFEASFIEMTQPPVERKQREREKKLATTTAAIRQPI